MAIEEILNEPEPQPAAESPSSSEAESRLRDERGRFAARSDDQPAQPSAEEPPFDHAAVIGERRRRQEAEQQLQAVHQELQRLRQPPQPQQPAPDFWDDPDAYFNHRLRGVLPHLMDGVRSEMVIEKFKDSAATAREKYQDYDETITQFQQMVAANPMLQQQVMASRNPAEFAYSTAKTAAEVGRYGSLDQLIQERVDAALSGQPRTPGIPTSLAGHQSARGHAAPYQPLSLEELLKG